MAPNRHQAIIWTNYASVYWRICMFPSPKVLMIHKTTIYIRRAGAHTCHDLSWRRFFWSKRAGAYSKWSINRLFRRLFCLSLNVMLVGRESRHIVMSPERVEQVHQVHTNWQTYPSPTMWKRQCCVTWDSCVSNHLQFDCLFKRFLRLTLKEHHQSFALFALCVRNLPVEMWVTVCLCIAHFRVCFLLLLSLIN